MDETATAAEEVLTYSSCRPAWCRQSPCCYEYRVSQSDIPRQCQHPVIECNQTAHHASTQYNNSGTGKKVSQTRLPSAGFRRWSRFLAVSLQLTLVINLAVGSHYFSPGLQLHLQSLRGLLPIPIPGTGIYYYFTSDEVTVDSSHTTASSSSASWNRFSPPFVNGHVSTMWFMMVCHWPQSHDRDRARPNLWNLAWHGPYSLLQLC